MTQDLSKDILEERKIARENRRRKMEKQRTQRFDELYFTERLRPANGCRKKKRGKGKKRTNNGSQNVSNNIEEAQNGDVNMEETQNVDVNMEETQNVDVNMEETQNVEMRVPNGPWLRALKPKQKITLLYSLGYLTLEHGTKAQELKDIVSKIGGEEARKYFSKLARSKALEARDAMSS
eukprot:jgi/Picsp_1/3549/NSC_06387-R1_---NA---